MENGKDHILAVFLYLSDTRGKCLLLVPLGVLITCRLL